MSNSHYHIHVIEAPNHQPMLDSYLSMFLENEAFTTRDLATVTDETTNYSRRCIDVCDFIIMVIGDSYGNTNASGVSQLHLSYLTVKTKNKPILIFIKSPSDTPRSRQLLDFIDNVEQRGPQQLYYFTDLPSFKQVLEQSYQTMCSIVPKRGWYKSNTLMSEPVSPLSKKVTKFSEIANKVITGLNTSSYNATLQELDKLSQQADCATDKRHLVVKPIQTKPLTLNNQLQNLDLPTKPTNSTKLSDYVASRTSSNTSSDSLYSQVDGALHRVSLHDTTELTYDAHAYQDGNIKEVTITTTMTWYRLLEVFSKLGKRFSSDTMHRALNEELKRSASESVLKILPKAHAVTRCTVRQSGFIWVQGQMAFNHWLIASTTTPSKSRTMWELTDEALIALQ